MKSYHKIPAQTEELEISTGYEEGGYSYFSGEKSERGLYVYFREVSRGANGSISFMVFDDAAFKILILPMARRNKNKQTNKTRRISH